MPTCLETSIVLWKPLTGEQPVKLAGERPVNLAGEQSVTQETLVAEAIEYHRSVRRAESEATPHAWEAGSRLLRIRAERKKTKTWEASFKNSGGQKYDDGTDVPNGDLAEISLSTAKRYIRLALRYPALESLRHGDGYMPLCEAYERAGIFVQGKSEAEKAVDAVTALGVKVVKLKDTIHTWVQDAQSTIREVLGRNGVDEDDLALLAKLKTDFNNTLLYLERNIGFVHIPQLDPPSQPSEATGDKADW